MKTLKIKIGSHNAELHPYGVVFLPDTKTLLIADLHLGKVNHFRKSGIAVPIEVKKTNYQKLNALVELYQPVSIYFLGDLFHSIQNEEWQVFSNWLKGLTFDPHLVIGNHDRYSIKDLEISTLKLHHRINLNGLVLTHEPAEGEIGINICGHIHPSVLLRGRGKAVAKVPCFAETKNSFVLPAFGDFTGTYTMKPNECKHVYLVLDDEVLLLK